MSSYYNHGFRSVYKFTAHLVLVTKYRRKAINQEILVRLQEILAETLKKYVENQKQPEMETLPR
ncbi:transposase [Crocosphaera sp. XPORK-15E]|uniref:transposase n=1 Tax=Crocosphaera sp. XPORK-15E TaxID=3110247 RepID=UPI002B1EACF7|nr:transposase [Crocosphaera sp. XPORK-15E]MEA5536412.1 transposase [Crocosphaera sp. XPORK-15E]